MEYQEYLNQVETLQQRRNQINNGLRTKQIEELTNEQELEELIATSQVILRLSPTVPSEFADDYYWKVDALRRNIYYFNTLIEQLKRQRATV